MVLAGLGDFSGKLLVGFGLISMLVAGIFIMRQSDYKRMLAYSSIENMGVIAFGVGIGGFALYGAILHMIHHSLIKSSLFLSAGNIMRGFGSKAVKEVGGLIKYLPKTFLSFFAGFIGIAGLPPFGLFLSELFILIGTFQAHKPVAAFLFGFSLLLVIAGAAKIVMEMSFSDKPAWQNPMTQPQQRNETFMRTFPPYVLLLASLVLCIWMPDRLYTTIVNTIQIIEGTING